jgi:hypothetical protein
MRVPRAVRFWTAPLLLGYWTALHAAPAAAGLAPSRVSGETVIASTRDADLVAARRALEHKLVVQKLRYYGVAAADVEARLASRRAGPIDLRPRGRPRVRGPRLPA